MAYTYELKEDESGKIVSILIDGKPIKKSFMNAFIKAQTSRFFERHINGGVLQNPYSGAQVTVNPLELMICRFVLRWYNQGYMANCEDVPVSVYDNMRYFLANINSNVYYDLID